MKWGFACFWSFPTNSFVFRSRFQENGSEKILERLLAPLWKFSSSSFSFKGKTIFVANYPTFWSLAGHRVLRKEHLVLETESVGSNPSHGEVFFSIFFSFPTVRTLSLIMLVGTCFSVFYDSSRGGKREEPQKNPISAICKASMAIGAMFGKRG